MNYKTSNGVEYDYYLAREGAHFILFGDNQSSKKLKEAKRELRRDRDVLSIIIEHTNKNN